MGAKKRKPGRPRKPEGQAKGVTMHVRVREPERVTLRQAAAAADKTFSEWARAKLLAAAKRESARRVKS